MNSKKVNVYPVMPIFTVYPPITQKQEGVELSLGKIEKCLMARAKVEEVFPNGQTIRLNLRNYDKELSPIYHKEEPKVDEDTSVKVEDKEGIVEESVVEEEEPKVDESTSVNVEDKEDIIEDIKSEEEPQPSKVEVKQQYNKQQKNNYKKR